MSWPLVQIFRLFQEPTSASLISNMPQTGTGGSTRPTGEAEVGKVISGEEIDDCDIPIAER